MTISHDAGRSTGHSLPPVSFITHLFPPGPGGMQRWNLQMARSYVRAGYDVTVYHFRKGTIDPGPDSFRYVPLTVNASDDPRVSSHYRYHLRSVIVIMVHFIRLLPALARRRGIWQITFGEPLLLKLLTIVAAVVLRIPVITAAGCVTFRHPYRGTLNRIIKQSITRCIYRRSSAILVDGSDLRQELIDHGISGDRIHVCYATVDTVTFAPSGTRSMLLERCAGADRSFDPARPLVLYCSRLSPENAPLDFISAVARLETVQAIVAGDGPLRSEITAAASHLKERVAFIGTVPYDELPLLFSRSDACLFTFSVHIGGISQVVPLAMACEGVVVTTRVGDKEALISHGINGFLAPPGDIESMAREVRGILENPAKANLVRKQARATILRDWTELSRDKLYHDLLAGLSASEESTDGSVHH
jgi:glycosyltransferase involved in cell wall biosynthesis